VRRLADLLLSVAFGLLLIPLALLTKDDDWESDWD
jgi:hypothetical protein